jgi:hypothetical protein
VFIRVLHPPEAAELERQDLTKVCAGSLSNQGRRFGSLGDLCARGRHVVVEEWESFVSEVEIDTRSSANEAGTVGREFANAGGDGGGNVG